MQRYEYKKDYCFPGHGGKDSDVEKFLNDYGDQGWHVVHFRDFSDSFGNLAHMIIFEREVMK